MNRVATRLAFVLSGTLFMACSAQAGFKEDMLKQLGVVAGSSPAATETETGKPALSNLSQAEMSQGLKEALSKGVKNAIAQLKRERSDTDARGIGPGGKADAQPASGQAGR